MLKFNGSNDSQCSSIKLLGFSSQEKSAVHLISNNVSNIIDLSSDGGNDTCSFYSGPSDAAILSFGESVEYGAVAYSGSSESCGSVAYSGSSESCGSVACSSVSTSSYSGGCSYSC